MTTKTKITGLIMALMALSMPLVYADNGGGDKDTMHQDGGWHHGKEGHMMAKILNLSDDQVKQLKDIHQKQREAMKTVFGQLKSNREAFDAEIVKATPDMNKINDIQTQLKTIQTQMVDNRLSSLLDIKKILTPEQFAGYMALKKERMIKKHMRGHGKFGHRDSLGHKNWGDKDKGDRDHDSDSQE